MLLFILSIGSGPHGVESEIDVPTLKSLQAELAMLEADVANKTAQLDAAINSEADQPRARPHPIHGPETRIQAGRLAAGIR